MSHPFSNRLIHETSPYLLQHAHNPVDWYPWSEEALERAKRENKPVLVSIGYSACHWCHVMERESFENEEVAAFMNENFINIKIDREERPDLDHIYMDAVQAMTGAGGWPLNVFLTPGAKPFFGGTYFPPVKAYNRSSWQDVLSRVLQAWQQRPGELLEQADRVTEHIRNTGDPEKFVNNKMQDDPVNLFLKEHAEMIFLNIMKSADREWGGFGKAPKFPQTFCIQYLLQYHDFTGNEEALQQALLSINKMLEGGIYDHAGGGMARYSTDNEWLAPHFEKMLYDNALLVNVLCDAYQLTRQEDLERAIRKTIGFVERDLMHPGGGFYSALDADSEGTEGKYYVWNKIEIDEILGADSKLFCAYFNVSEQGNWEQKNILRVLKKSEEFAKDSGLDPVTFRSGMESSLDKLLHVRRKRTPPQLDDKIILGWNALMITALCKAASALHDREFRDLAEMNFAYLMKHFRTGQGEWEMYHTVRGNVAKYPAFLDDYAFLVQSCIRLQELTSDGEYLLMAKGLTEHVIRNFSEGETGFFYYTNLRQKDVILRSREIYDGAIPSGNSVMADNLLCLSVVFDVATWHRLAYGIASSLIGTLTKHPSSFANWACTLLNQLRGINEIIITGEGSSIPRDNILQLYIPNKIIQCSVLSDNRFPTLKGKKFENNALIYLCRNQRCHQPVKTPRELQILLKQMM